MSSEVRSHIGAKDVKRVTLSAEDCRYFNQLEAVGIGFDSKYLSGATSIAMDSVAQNPILSPSVTTPVQFLQSWLPGFVHVITAARKIDEIVGITTIGNWYDEEIVQGAEEFARQALPYGDHTNVPLSDFNVTFERRTIVRLEMGLQVGRLEEARIAQIRLDAGSEKRYAAARALEFERNRIGFFGYNNGTNRTYGFVNDPALPAVGTLPSGKKWTDAGVTFQDVQGDIRAMVALLQVNSQDNINPEDVDLTLVLPTTAYQALGITTDYGYSVRKWLTDTYPRIRIVSTPDLVGVNDGENLVYLFADDVDDTGTDGGATFIQIVPAKFMALGIQQAVKTYLEDYTSATAGVLCKRPWAVVRYTGL